MNLSEIISLISGIVAVLSIVFAILTFAFNRNGATKKEVRQSAGDMASMKTDIVYIKDGVAELKQMVGNQSKEASVMKVTLGKLEERVYNLENKVKEMDSK